MNHKHNGWTNRWWRASVAPLSLHIKNSTSSQQSLCFLTSQVYMDPGIIWHLLLLSFILVFAALPLLWLLLLSLILYYMLFLGGVTSSSCLLLIIRVMTSLHMHWVCCTSVMLFIMVTWHPPWWRYPHVALPKGSSFFGGSFSWTDVKGQSSSQKTTNNQIYFNQYKIKCFIYLIIWSVFFSEEKSVTWVFIIRCTAGMSCPLDPFLFKKVPTWHYI